MIFPLSDRVQQLLIENRDVVKASVVASRTFLRFVLCPMKLCTFALLAKVASKRRNLEEAEKRKELPDALQTKKSAIVRLFLEIQSRVITFCTGVPERHHL